MKKNVQKKYLFAVYLIIALIAGLVGLLAYNREEDFWKAILLNFSTELLGVVFIFALVNYFLLLEDWSLSEQVAKLVEKLNNREKVLANDFFTTSAIPHRIPEDHYHLAHTVYIVGYSLTRVVRQNMGLYSRLLERGVNFRFLVLDSENGHVLNQINARTTDNLTLEHWEVRLKEAKAILHALRNVANSKGKVEIGYLPFIPGFGLALINPENPDAICFTLIYPHRSADTEPAFVVKASDDPHWYNFFYKQFNALWESSRKDNS